MEKRSTNQNIRTKNKEYYDDDDKNNVLDQSKQYFITIEKSKNVMMTCLEKQRQQYKMHYQKVKKDPRVVV